MRIDQLRQQLRSLGARAQHEERVLRQWAQARPLDGGRELAQHSLPLTLRQGLPTLRDEWSALARVHSLHQDADGSARLLVQLADGASVEAVLLPRDGLCVSTQVGCAVACGFCMTGREGLQRQLGSAEIVAQVAAARAQRAVHKVVFMGMGEPSHNLDQVLDAIDFLGTLGGIGHKELVFSTVGDLRAFERLHAGGVKPALALSLHTTKVELRTRLLPRAPRIEPATLVVEGDRYARASGYPMQVQWTLLAGVNDGNDEVDAAAALLRGRHAMLNLIPYNAVPGLPFERPSWERATELARAFNRRGVLTRLRRSAGQDVDGGCGQLRARTLQSERSIAMQPEA